MARLLHRLAAPVVALVLCAAAISAQAASAQITVTLPVTADAELRSSAPNSNLGDELELYLGNRAGATGKVALRAPVWRLPRGITIDHADLEFSVGGWSDVQGTQRSILAYRVSAPWHEHIATWNRSPSIAEVVGQVQVGTPQVETWYSIDLTVLVREWYTGAALDNGVLLAAADNVTDRYRVFGSRETTVAPRLVVIYHAAAAPALHAQPPALGFAAAGVAPAKQTLTIHNDGEGAIEWSGQTGASWLPLGAPSGVIEPGGQSQPIDVAPAVAGLASGQYRSSIQVAGHVADLRAASQSVGVTLDYSATPGALLPRSYLALARRGTSQLLAAQPAATTSSFVGLYIGLTHYRFLPSPNASASGRESTIPNGEPLHAPDADALSARATMIQSGPPPVATSALPTAAVGGSGSWFPGIGLFAQYTANDILWPETSPVSPPDSSSLSIITNGIAAVAGPARSQPDDAAGTLDGLRRAFAWVDDHEGLGSTVLITYSGHGAQVPDDNSDEPDGLDEVIAAADAKVEVSAISQVLRDDELGALLSNLESQRVILIMDSCFAGGLYSTAGAYPPGARPRLLPGAPRPLRGGDGDGLTLDAGAPGRLILSASRADQVSWEFDSLGHGVFTYFILQALLDPAADTDRDGWVAAEEAFVYAAPRVDAFVFAHTGEHQNPQMYDGIPGNVKLAKL